MTLDMKRLFLISVLFNLLSITVLAQSLPVETIRIKKAYNALISGACSAETEMEFLEAYPTTWLEFYMTYSCNSYDTAQDSMCDMCSEHISALYGLSHIYK